MYQHITLKGRPRMGKSLFNTAFGKFVTYNLPHSKFEHKVIFVDSAPTSKGKCFDCRKLIPKSTPRAWFLDYMYVKNLKYKPKKWIGENGEIQIKRLLCFDCAPARIVGARSKLRDLQTYYRFTLKKFKRMTKGKKAQSLIKGRNALEELDKDGF